MGKAALITKVRSTLRATLDGWENVFTGHSTARDKRTGGRIQPVRPSTTWQEFEDIYHGDDLAGRIVDKPVSDMTRKWISLSVDAGDESVQVADDVLQKLDQLKAKQRIAEGLTWARVQGGARVFIGADDGAATLEAMEEPIRLDRIRDITHLVVYERQDLEIVKEYSDPFIQVGGRTVTNPKLGQPEIYRVRTISSARGQVTIPDMMIHESRFLDFNGVRTSRRRRLLNGGWYDSVYLKIEQILRDYSIAWGSVANILTDFAQGVLQIDNLADILASNEGDLVMERIRIMDMCRSVLRMTILGKDENFERRATPLSGVPEMFQQFSLRFAAAADMPITILLGQSPSGLNTTAEGDLSWWYGKIEAAQEDEIRDPLEYLIGLIYLSKDGPTKGKVPDGSVMIFNKLWSMSEKELAESRNIQSETDKNYIDTGVVGSKEVRESRFGGEAYSYETTLAPDDEDDETDIEEFTEE